MKLHIGLTRLLEKSVVTTSYDLEKRLFWGSLGLDWGDNREIKEVVAKVKDNKNKPENPQKKNKKL